MSVPVDKAGHSASAVRHRSRVLGECFTVERHVDELDFADRRMFRFESGDALVLRCDVRLLLADLYS